MNHRIFFALELPPIDHYTPLLETAAKASASKLKIVDPDLYHLTVHFFGNVDDTQINILRAAFADYTFPSFELTLNKPNVIPPRKKTRVLYVGSKQDTAELTAAVATVHDKLRSLKFPVKQSKFLSHLTVARVKYSDNREKLAMLWEKSEFPAETIHISQLTLMESVLTPNGPIYTPVFKTM